MKPDCLLGYSVQLGWISKTSLPCFAVLDRPSSLPRNSWLQWLLLQQKVLLTPLDDGSSVSTHGNLVPAITCRSLLKQLYGLNQSGRFEFAFSEVFNNFQEFQDRSFWVNIPRRVRLKLIVQANLRPK